MGNPTPRTKFKIRPISYLSNSSSFVSLGNGRFRGRFSDCIARPSRAEKRAVNIGSGWKLFSLFFWPSQRGREKRERKEERAWGDESNPLNLKIFLSLSPLPSLLNFPLIKLEGAAVSFSEEENQKVCHPCYLSDTREIYLRNFRRIFKLSLNFCFGDWKFFSRPLADRKREYDAPASLDCSSLPLPSFSNCCCY